jgi:3-hydroxybutyryl-CoA dehydrogenase
MAVNRIAVISAGITGRGIAYVSAVSGFETTIEDIRPLALEQAMDWIRRTIEATVERGDISAEQARQALARVHTAGRVEDAADADLVIDAGPEDMELKTELFGMLDKFARAATILATSSASLSIAEMAEVTQRPERCVGMRFFDPVPEMKRIELIRGPETSQETLEACRDVGQRMSKEVVTLGVSPEPATARISRPIGRGKQKGKL